LGSQNAWNSGYGFYITRSGQYAIYSYNGGTAVQLQPWTFSSAIIQGDAWNELRVTASGSQLAFYINGGLVWVGNNDAHSSGRVGVALYRDPSSPDNKLWVDWATLSPTVTAADPGQVSAEQQALNEAAREESGAAREESGAAWKEAGQGSDGRAPVR
jgi:hypothetical protein